MNRIELGNNNELTILFAHGAFNLSEAFGQVSSDIRHSQVWTAEDCAEKITDADIAMLSTFWSPSLLDNAPKLKMIHAPAAGYDQFDLELLKERGIILINSRGTMANAVAEHGIALILSFTRQLNLLRDAQRDHVWRDPIMLPLVPADEDLSYLKISRDALPLDPDITS